MIIVCLFVLNDIAFGLAPSSRFKPMVTVVKHDDGTYEVVTDDGEQRFWKAETLRSVRAGETLGRSFRNRVSFMYISGLIGQYLHLGISPHTVIPEIKRLVDPAELAASRMDDPLLSGFEIEELSYNEEENAFYLPIYREGIKSFYYKYYVDGSKGDPDMTILVAENKHVYIEIEPVLEIEAARPVFEVIRDIRAVRHDLRNLISAFLGLKLFWKEMGCMTPGLAQLLDLGTEISYTLDALPVETKDEAVLHAYLKKLKGLVIKAMTDFAPANTEPILEEARRKVPEEEDPDRQSLVDSLVSNLDFAKNILVDQLDRSKQHVTTVKLNSVIDTVMVANPTARRIVKRNYLAGDIDIQTDEIALSRALANIVVNAGEAIEDNELEGDFRIVTRLTGDNKNVQVILSDTAGGIRPEVLSRIFDEYFSTKQSEDVKKRGQGLFITKKYIEERCGGTIDVESELGKGTTFTITLPLSGPGTKPEQPEEKEEPVTRTIPEPERIIRFGAAIRSFRHDAAVLFDTYKNMVSVIGAWGLLGDESQKDAQKANDRIKEIIDNAGDGSKEGKLNISDVEDYTKQLEEILKGLQAQKLKVDELISSLVDDEKKDEQKKMLLDMLERNLGQTIEKLQSRLELAGGVSCRSSHVINDTIENILPDSIENKTPPVSDYIKFENRLSRPVSVKGNRLSVANALLNLISNGVFFAGKKQQGKAEVIVSLVEEDGFAKIAITDNGEGIPPELLEKDPVTGIPYLFNLNVSQREGGTGLGTTEALLAITDADGTIDVDSEPGKGTTFTVKLPITMSEREKIERFAVAMRSCRHGKGTELFDIPTDLTVIASMFGNMEKQEIRGKIVEVSRTFAEILYKTSAASKEGTLDIDHVAERLRRLNEILAYLKTLTPEAEAINLSDFPVYTEEIELCDQQEAARFKVGFREAIEKLESRIGLATAEADDSLHSINDIICDISALSPYMKVENRISGTAGFRGNRRSIINALSNIIMNADHFATKGQGEKAEISVWATEKDGFSNIKIKDNGEGIPKWMLDVDPETGREYLFNLNISDREGGTGLGTTEAWYAIRDAGGTIEVGSELGGGTIFTVKIPLSDVKVRPRPLRHDEILSSRPVPEDEETYTILFEDTVKLIQSKDEERPVILALGTDWMKGYEKGRYLQYDILNPLVASIRSFCEHKGIVFIDGKEEGLLSAIEQARGDSENAKVIVLASEKTVRSEDFKSLRKDKNAFLAGVNDENLTVDSYIRLVEMMDLALRFAFDRSVDFDNPNVAIKKVTGFPNLIIFIPKAEPMDYEILKDIYRIQTFA